MTTNTTTGQGFYLNNFSQIATRFLNWLLPWRSAPEQEAVSLPGFDSRDGIATLLSDHEFWSNFDLNLTSIARFGDVFDEFGYRDGRIGHLHENFESAAKMLYRAFVQQVTVRCQAEIGRGNDQKVELEKKSESENRSIASLRERIADHTDTRGRRPGQYDIILGLFYIITACLLMYAEFDVSRESLLPIFGKNSSPKDFILFPLAIVFISFYIKIIYEEYVQSPLVHLKEDVSASLVLKPKWEQRFIRIISIIRMALKLFVTGGVLFLLYQIGLARKAGGLSAEHAALLLVLFPVISGILLSYGVLNLRNRISFSFTKKRLKRLEIRSGATNSKLELIEVANKNLKAQQLDCAEISFKNEFLNYIQARYEHGFRRGFLGRIPVEPIGSIDAFSKARYMQLKDRLTQYLPASKKGL